MSKNFFLSQMWYICPLNKRLSPTCCATGVFSQHYLLFRFYLKADSLISAPRHRPTQREKPARLSALLNAAEIQGHFEHTSKYIPLTVPIAIFDWCITLKSRLGSFFLLYFQKQSLRLETHWTNNVLGTFFLHIAVSVNDKTAMCRNVVTFLRECSNELHWGFSVFLFALVMWIGLANNSNGLPEVHFISLLVISTCNCLLIWMAVLRCLMQVT